VAFLRASSIAASSWALLVPLGFLTASTWTTRLEVLVWTFSVDSGLEIFFAFNSSILFFDYSSFLAAASAFSLACLISW